MDSLSEIQKRNFDNDDDGNDNYKNILSHADNQQTCSFSITFIYKRCNFPRLGTTFFGRSYSWYGIFKQFKLNYLYLLYRVISRLFFGTTLCQKRNEFSFTSRDTRLDSNRTKSQRSEQYHCHVSKWSSKLSPDRDRVTRMFEFNQRLPRSLASHQREK